MPTLISSQFKGLSNTNDGTMVAMMYDGSDVHPSLTCNNAGGGQRMPDKENFNGIIEMETEIQNFKSNLAGGDTDTAMVTGDHDSRSTDFTNLVTYSVDQGGGKSSCNVHKEVAPTTTTTHQGEPVVNQYHYAVRRITPIEGERLQGFADNWTRSCFTPSQITDELVDRFVAIHQQWAVINGKSNKPKSREWVRKWLTAISGVDCPDGPRYKAIGNSMSVNVMNWIGQVIEMENNKGAISR